MNATHKYNEAVTAPSTTAAPVTFTRDASSPIKTSNDAAHLRKVESAEEAKGCQLIRAALVPDEIAHLADHGMVLRHYRAEKGNVDSAITKIKNTIRWRREFGVADIVTCFDDLNDNSLKPLRDTFREEAKTGKLYVRGHDRGGRAIQYMAPGRENTRDETNQMKFLVYTLERAVACTAAEQARRRRVGIRHTINPGEEKICIIINFDQWTLRKSPPMSTTLYTLEILQKHYCERLHRAYVFNPPKFFVYFWNLIHRFVDPVTKDKIQFCTGVEGLKRIERDIDLGKVENFVGGTGSSVLQFDSEKYLLKYPHSSTFGDDPLRWRQNMKEYVGNVDDEDAEKAEEKKEDEDRPGERGSFRRCNSHSLFTGTF
mmetsp:Transcript_23662/g.68105  ORF Transcript_23662/g.68105 Transcript_23662/m.68105 type:complete len:372 (-) Transcript_23662:40-1155(-)